MITAGGRGEVVVMARLLTTIVNGPEVLDSPTASVSMMVIVAFPAAVGVPVILTVFVLLEARDNPAGRVPDAMDQLRGGTPPVAVTGPV